MKACTRLKEMMPDAHYGELSGKDKKWFQGHLDVCPSCEDEYLGFTRLLKVMTNRKRPEMSDDFWDNYYSRLEEKLAAVEEAREPSKINLTQTNRSVWNRWMGGLNIRLKWFLYPAAAMAILVMGISIGRYQWLPAGQEIIEGVLKPFRNPSPAVSQHFDNVRPLLIDYSNTSDDSAELGSDDMVRVERDAVDKLLKENQLLKQIVAKQNNMSLKQVMDDLEIVLLELANSNGNRAETRETVQQLIRGNDLLFKMDVIGKKPKMPARTL